MKCSNLSETIREIRNSPAFRVIKNETSFPYYELYGKSNKHIRIKASEDLDPKLNLMNRIRMRYQALINPHQHQITLKRSDFNPFIPKIQKLLFDSKGKKTKICTVEKFPRSNHSMSVPPHKKKNILFYRITNSRKHIENDVNTFEYC